MRSLYLTLTTAAVLAIASMTGQSAMAETLQIKADQKTKVKTESVESLTRLGINHNSGLELKTFVDRTEDNSGIMTEQTSGGWLAYGFPIQQDSTGTNINAKLYGRFVQEVENGVKTNTPTVAGEVVIDGQTIDAYIIPIWASADSTGIASNFGYGNVSATFGNHIAKGGIVWDWQKKDKDEFSGFVGYENNDLAVGIADYVGDPIAGIGFSGGNTSVGTMGWAQTDYTNSDWKFTGFVAQNPTGLLSAKGGMQAWLDYVAIGAPQEVAPYFTSAACKSKGGIAGKLVLENKDDVLTVTPDVGFKQGNIALTVSQPLSIDNGHWTTTSPSVIGTYTDGNFTGELTYSTDGTMTAYAGFSAGL